MGLFTQHDTYNVHKILGLYCLVHFAYRFPISRWFRNDIRHMGFGGNWATPVSLFPHFLLSVSSLIFHIPRKRIKEGSRIWPEFRLQSIAFACRSLVCMMLKWAEDFWSIDTSSPFLSALVVFLTMAAADYSGRITAKQNTIQGLDTYPVVKYLFSVAQFVATARCIIGAHNYANHFLFIWIIQCTAFLMTLRRKNIVSHNILVGLYGLLLYIGMKTPRRNFIGVKERAWIMGATGTLLRMGFGWNKYVVWACVAYLDFETKTRCSLEHLQILYYGNFAILTIVGIYKIKYYY
jgi:hypothetical protein